jgi:hypothetical protein
MFQTGSSRAPPRRKPRCFAAWAVQGSYHAPQLRTFERKETVSCLERNIFPLAVSDARGLEWSPSYASVDPTRNTRLRFGIRETAPPFPRGGFDSLLVGQP